MVENMLNLYLGKKSDILLEITLGGVNQYYQINITFSFPYSDSYTLLQLRKIVYICNRD